MRYRRNSVCYRNDPETSQRQSSTVREAGMGQGARDRHTINRLMVLCLIFILYYVSPLPIYAQQHVYMIHVSSYQQMLDADKEVSRLETAGNKVFCRHELVKGKGMWYRIYVGVYDTHQEARAVAGELKRKGVISYHSIMGLHSASLGGPDETLDISSPAIDETIARAENRKPTGKVSKSLSTKPLTTPPAYLESVEKFAKVNEIEILSPVAADNNELGGSCVRGNCTDGQGVFVFSNGDKYVGQFSGGVAKGKGALFYADGSIIEGVFLQLKRSMNLSNNDSVPVATSNIATRSGEGNADKQVLAIEAK